MNLSEPYRARTSAFVALAAAGWEGYALRVALLALGLSIYILLFKKRNSPGARSSSRGSRDVPDDGDGDGDGDDDASDHLNGEAKEFSHGGKGGPRVPYDGEVCPICLGVPKIGVKAPCGHLLCADCLASYCDVRITPAPPPCPLCRAPLNSVALACDFTIPSPKTLDPNTMVMVQNWIREYNNHRGLMTQGRRTFLTTRFILFFNILTLFLLIGLITTRLQVLARVDEFDDPRDPRATFLEQFPRELSSVTSARV
ncbi:hypothetical protein EAI_15774 [Harpegnathos saltator]|uniref:RING-type domain-containing protein n=1 Tax=Harpegnathos saltator TaxID=610380 RepID=E2C8D1_HARSA|nr:hypothetical protein EAI_15774 [Harpegnathos saltator]